MRGDGGLWGVQESVNCEPFSSGQGVGWCEISPLSFFVVVVVVVVVVL